MAGTAFCYRSGEIGFAVGQWRNVPEFTLALFTCDSISLTRAIAGAIARHSYDGVTLLVPGVPEAEDDKAAMAAVERFRTMAASRPGVRVRQGGGK